MPRARRAPRLTLALILALLLAALAPAPGPAGAATFEVTNGNDSGDGSLRAAIAAAEATPEPDTITFAPGVAEVTLTSGELAVTRDLAIQGSGRGGVAIRRSAAPATPAFRLINITNGAHLTLRGLTLANGDAGGDFGGGVLAERSRLTVEVSVLTGNRAEFGGGIAALAFDGGSAAVTVTSSTLSGNTAASDGGGIEALAFDGTSAAVTVSNSTIEDNSATSFGGGIDAFADAGSAATLAVTDSTLSGNSAGSDGGGIAAYAFDGGSTAVTISNSALSGNSAGASSGGILAIASATGSTLTMAVISSTLADNTTAGPGGGIGAYAGVGGSTTLAVTDSTLSGNNAARGGGIVASTAQDSVVAVRLAHATLADNTASDPDVTVRAHHLRLFGAGAAVTATRSVLAHSNTALAGPFVVTDVGAFASGGHNVSQRDLPNAVASDLANTDPRLGPLADNGGSTRTHLPQPGSPAIDRSPADADCPAADQRGVPRPLGAGCDSGAVEAPCASGFPDVAATDPACTAIAMLVAQGVIKGYATTPPSFGPDDDVQRAQQAAFLVRALGWEARPTGPRDFADFDGLVQELQDAARILANACDSQGNCVARGYGDGTFGPTDPVTRAQAITLIARAFRLDPAFAWAPGTPAPGAPAQHAADIGMYIANAGAIPDAPTSQAEWDAPASRAWVAMALWQALQTLP